MIKRIADLILNQNIPVENFLVVTFTVLAASEMKERLLKALYDEIDKNPDDVHLQKQVNLINQALYPFALLFLCFAFLFHPLYLVLIL